MARSRSRPTSSAFAATFRHPAARFPLGNETLEFSDGRLLVQQVLSEETQRQALFLFGDDEISSLGFERDPETRSST